MNFFKENRQLNIFYFYKISLQRGVAKYKSILVLVGTHYVQTYILNALQIC
jgi:hypothetical protein